MAGHKNGSEETIVAVGTVQPHCTVLIYIFSKPPEVGVV